MVHLVGFWVLFWGFFCSFKDFIVFLSVEHVQEFNFKTNTAEED